MPFITFLKMVTIGEILKEVKLEIENLKITDFKNSN
jgi:hypothetical protein